MTHLQALAGGANLAAALFVAVLSWLVLRLRPLPFFRAWAYGSMAAVVTTALSLWTLQGSLTLLSVAALSAAACAVLYFQAQMIAALLGQPFPRLHVIAFAGLVWAAGLVIAISGATLLTALLPTLGLTVVMRFATVVAMLHAGRTPAYRGLGWLALPVALHGAWLMTYPLIAGTPWEWGGHLIDGALKLAEGVGLTTYVLVHAVRELSTADQLKQEFLDAASHELRAPLTTVVGYAEMLADDESGLPSDQAALATEIQDAAMHLARLVDAMLETAFLDAGTVTLTVTQVDLVGLIQAEIEGLIPLADERTVRLRGVVPDDVLAACVDAAAIRRVLRQLLTNAIQATPAGGEVRVAARRALGGIRVEVANTGQAISARELPHMFERFYRAESGAGLGLAASQALVQAHGSRIQVRSAPGERTVFWFVLPT